MDLTPGKAHARGNSVKIEADIGRLHEILAKLWWRMRELVYEAKPVPKHRQRAPKSSLHKAALAGDAVSEADETYLVRLV